MRTLVLKRRGFAMLELAIVVVVGVLLMFALAVLLPHHTRGEPSTRIKCASNLRQIGQAMLLYANENHGQYPRGIYVSAKSVIPTWGTAAAFANPFEEDGPVNDVSSAMFLLLRTQDIGAEVFICPTSTAEKWDFGGGAKTVSNWSNWDDIQKHLSYSLHNPYLDEDVQKRFNDVNTTSGKWAWNNTLGSEFAVAADLNPGVAKGNVNVLTVTTTSSSRDMRSGNSPNHQGDGQNVLYGDGHVTFEQSPFVGVDRDNIYATRTGKVIGSMQDEKDSILLPTAQ